MKLISLFLLLTAGMAHAQNGVNPVPSFKKVVWIWLENTPYDSMSIQKYIRYLWLNYPSVRFSNMKAVAPVTQANTVAMITGNDFSIRDNDLLRIFTPTIVNLLEDKRVSWRAYAEDYPGACFFGEGTTDYKRYRVPFLSVSQIQTDHYLCSKVVSFKFLEDDLKYNTLPQFSIVVPSLYGSGAIGGVGAALNTLSNVITPILNNPELLAQTTIIITTTTNVNVADPELFSMILGNGVSGYSWTIDQEYNHYNILRTIEDGFHLGQLNQNDTKAEPVLGFWQ